MHSDPLLTKQQVNQQIDGLYRAHQAWLYGWLCKKLGNQSDAADLTQDTFVKVMYRYADYYYHEPRALLTTIAKSLLFNLYRRRKVEQAYLSVLAEDSVEQTFDVEDHILLIETLCELCEIIETMPQRQKQVFILSQLEGLSYAEISEKLDISIATIKRDLTKAMAICFMAME
ncbi:sigma-70 family RNA polymerase sigma factor [Acinetobacter puyangensis]|uniref:RNA polymerase sigma-70 factor, ECF subfamily n=1 Tax=Acinetobacter puyangensis TaxID=1096779 RepID=A0A240E5I4_9GAMM|nr:sigma-70 family RNA polymerase sigma factor [Acinetobacter puyangensis]SNX43523.1 RNA polymerase sigma-70 factor, ECF subfamily [Acinetobacter puyangensis]